MDPAYAIRELGRNKEIFTLLLSKLEPEEFNWRPTREKWNILEILCHLRDEECEDFRARTRGALEEPNKPFTSIHPEGWVKDRAYAQEDHEEALKGFLYERQRSIQWLSSLKDPNWNNIYHHEQLGDLSAQLFLENWIAHDMLHIRQVMNTRLAYLGHIAEEPLDYAGGV
jgi:hypothetical protein